MHSLFPRFNTLLKGIFWDLFELRRRGHFDQIDVRKMGSFQNRFNLGEKEKVTGTRLGKCGGVPRLQCSFVQETDKYSELCEQERYRDGAFMRGLSKGSASCHSLISQGAEECLYRRFGSLFGLRIGIRNEQCLEYRRIQ